MARADGGFIRCDSDNSESSDDNLSPNAASVDGLEVTVRLLGTGMGLSFVQIASYSFDLRKGVYPKGFTQRGLPKGVYLISKL